MLGIKVGMGVTLVAFSGKVKHSFVSEIEWH